MVYLTAFKFAIQADIISQIAMIMYKKHFTGMKALTCHQFSADIKNVVSTGDFYNQPLVKNVDATNTVKHLLLQFHTNYRHWHSGRHEQ